MCAGSAPFRSDDSANPLAGIDRHCAFFDHYLISIDAASDFARYRFNVREVSIAALGRRSTNCNKHSIAFARGRLQIAGKLYALAAMPRQQLGQKALMDWHLAVSERGDFFLVIIDQDNLVPKIGETHSRHQPNVPGTDYRDAHSEPALLELFTESS